MRECISVYIGMDAYGRTCAPPKKGACCVWSNRRGQLLHLLYNKLVRTKPSISNYAQMHVCTSVYIGMDVYGRTCAPPKKGVR